MHKKKIAFIESNTTGTGCIFLKKALQMGLEVIFLTQDPRRYSFLSGLNKEVLALNTLDKDSILKSLLEIPNLAGVFSTSEYYIETAAVVAKALQLRGNDVESIVLCRNKRKFCEKLAASPFLIPQTWFAESMEDVVKQQNDFVYPLVVKPVSGTGSVGVRKCHEFSQVYHQASQLLLKQTNERGIETAPGILIQRFIQGPEFSAEIIGHEGGYYPLGITAKHTTNNDYFIETGHDFPAVDLPAQMQAKIWDTLKGVLKFFNFKFGPAHIEFKIEGSDIVLIEVNPRLAGGMIPQLICYACQIDLYEMIIKLYMNEKLSFQPLTYEGSSIRFFLAKKSGKIIDLVGEEILKQCKNVAEVHFTKQIGDHIKINNDYRDRIGCLITRASSPILSKQSADGAMEHFFVDINSQEFNGRLSEDPHSLIKQILRKPKDENKWIEELERISNIDLAHLLMLCKNGIIRQENCLPVILEIKNFQKNLPKYFASLDFSRGTYYAYENFLKDKLGLDLSGNNHMGRSRNDINAALFYLSCRDSFLKIYKKSLQLSELLLQKARISELVPLPIYSQHQPAAPGTYTFYLLAILEPVKRILQDLKGLEVYLNTSPLGAGAGGGTDIAIDPQYVAELLGFNTVFCNALDAIANRDFILRYEAILANLCMTLSRIAQDYQLWTTQEFHFFELPDALCGSSSMMPQKKNPYLLEVIKTKTMNLISNLLGTFAKMHKVPIGNSIEVSTAAYDNIDFTTQECLDALDLLILVITHAEPISENMVIANKKGLTIATAVANRMMKQQGISFREAHLKVGGMIRKAQECNENAFIQLAKFLEPSSEKIEDQKLIHHVVEHLKYGGGPAPVLTSNQIKFSSSKLCEFSDWINNQENKWMLAKARLDREVKSFINEIDRNKEFN